VSVAPIPRPMPTSPMRRKRRRWPHRAAIGLFLLIVLPVVLLAGAGNPPCLTTPTTAATPTGPAPSGMFAQPLHLLPGRWYTVGATEYGGPNDPSSGMFGSSGAYLPSLPDSFAELSLLDSNPANGGTLTFADANALGNLPYGTAIRVRNGPAERVLVKRDVGYGQGPGQTIPYRIDVWWQAAQPLGITKNPVQIQLAPSSGSGGVLGQLPGGPATTTGTAGTPSAAGCNTGALGPLPLTPGQTATINPQTGIASAPVSAPRQVKLAIAAGNQIINKPYPVPDVHYGPLSSMWPAYDCSGTVSYVLYKLGLLQVAEDSGELESFGDPGPGKWITVYATSGHTWIDIAGIALDTSPSGNPSTWAPPGSGPRWRPNPTGNLADGWSYVVRHPNGL
jgi:hypothetical protein